MPPIILSPILPLHAPNDLINWHGWLIASDVLGMRATWFFLRRFLYIFPGPFDFDLRSDIGSINM